jgi:hypothetical protein
MKAPAPTKFGEPIVEAGWCAASSIDILFLVASWFLIPGVTFALCLVFSGDMHSSLMDVLPLLPAALLTPAALISPACLFAVDARTEKEWARLQID